jgi:type I restriction enzyme S subunit
MYWLQAGYQLLNLYGGYGNKTTIPNLSQARLKSFNLPVLPLPEQRTIAAILSKIQQASETQEMIIERTKELKKSLMAKLFTEGLHGEELKETEIGLMPKSWEVVTVEDLGQIVTGTTPPTADPDNFGLKYPFITPVDLGATKYIYKTQRYLSDKGLSLSRPLPKDSVLVTCIGSTVGKVGLTFIDDSISNQQINTIICGDRFDPQFVYYSLDFKSDYIRSLSTPSPVPILSKGKFTKALVGLPMDKDEQREMSKPLAALDTKMETANKKSVMLTALFKSMLHQLMTGQVRVNNVDVS